MSVANLEKDKIETLTFQWKICPESVYLGSVRESFQRNEMT